LSADTTAPLPIAVELVTVARDVSAKDQINVEFEPLLSVCPDAKPLAVFWLPETLLYRAT
jgi:hypothetical protein